MQVQDQKRSFKIIATLNQNSHYSIFPFSHSTESLIQRPRHLIRKNPIERGQRSVNLGVSSRFFFLCARQTNSLHKWSAAAAREESFSTNKGEEGERASERMERGVARPSGAFNRQQAHRSKARATGPRHQAGGHLPMYECAMCRPLLITYHSNASNRSRLTSTLPFDSYYMVRHFPPLEFHDALLADQGINLPEFFN